MRRPPPPPPPPRDAALVAGLGAAGVEGDESGVGGLSSGEALRRLEGACFGCRSHASSRLTPPRPPLAATGCCTPRSHTFETGAPHRCFI